MVVKVTKKYQIEGEIKEIVCKHDSCHMTIASPEICHVAKAGQFLMVKTNDMTSSDPLLRRPFSIHRIYKEEISIVFKIVGRGTKLLSNKKKSELINVVGPLGNGFNVTKNENYYLVGGGMGIAPLYFLAQYIKKILPESKIVALLGAKNGRELEIFSDFNLLEGLEVKISTDDGSKGHHGLVLDLLMQVVVEKGHGTVYCCGPWPMMKAIAGYCQNKKMSCQVSLETTMACGIGACLGCGIPSPNILEKMYIHVCKDGPVFEANKIWP